MSTFTQDALATNVNSNAWKTQFETTMQVDVTGTFASETYTLQYKNADGTWTNFVFDSTNTTATWTTNNVQSFHVAGGQQFRLAGDGGGGGTTDVNVRVKGAGVVAV